MYALFLVLCLTQIMVIKCGEPW